MVRTRPAFDGDLRTALRLALAKAEKLAQGERLKRGQPDARMRPLAFDVRKLLDKRAGVECVIGVEIPRRVCAIKVAQESRCGLLDPPPVLAALIADGLAGELDCGTGVCVTQIKRPSPNQSVSFDASLQAFSLTSTYR